MLRIIALACAAGVFAGGAFAQTTPAPMPPTGPTQVQCDQGYQEGSRWTKDQFVAACVKLRQGRNQ